jgi:hypothetical protein
MYIYIIVAIIIIIYLAIRVSRWVHKSKRYKVPTFLRMLHPRFMTRYTPPHRPHYRQSPYYANPDSYIYYRKPYWVRG